MNWKRFLPIVIVLAIVFLAGYAYYWFGTFHVESTNPRNGSSTSLAPKMITITFNREIEPISLEENIITSDNIISGMSTLKNKIIIETRNQEVGQTYRITFRNITSKDGDLMKRYDFSYTNKYVEAQDRSKQEQKKLMDEQNANAPKEDLALTELPISTDDFYIRAITLDKPQDGKNIKLSIALLVSSDKEKDVTTVREYKAKADNWLAAKGIKKENYVVRYSPEIANNL